jgi:CubicO group peptidase (beta-lactamase class C family)
MTDAQRAFNTLLVTIDDLAGDRTLDAEFPAANGICTARSLARLHGALVGPVEKQPAGPGRTRPHPRVLSRVVERAAERLVSGTDRVFHATTAFGLGFMVPGSMQFDGWGGHTFGHPGNGGAIGLADIEPGLAFGYVRKRMTQLVRNDTTQALLRALYRCLR